MESASEIIRRRVIEDLLLVDTVSTCWPTWKSEIWNSMPSGLSAKGLINELGTSLSRVFSSTNMAGRNQSSQSGAGTAWEALICWYLNICLIGTQAVVIKKTSHVPMPIREALTVMYGTVKTNTESDLVAITLPEDSILDGYSKQYFSVGRVKFDDRLSSLLAQVEVCIIQCKTNWNENAQIPMLWDLIYSATGFQSGRASVGINGHTVKALRRFAYAFATVPTNRLEGYNRNSSPVLRVTNLSGGNYWGREALNGVASSLPDIFTKNFFAATQNLGLPWKNHLNDELRDYKDKYSYFSL